MGKDLNGKELGKGLRQRPDGRYELRIYVKGIKKPTYFYSFSISELKKKKKEFITTKAPLSQRYNIQLTVSKWNDEWMSLYVVASKKNTTIENYVNGFERVREYIGYKKLIDVTPSDISYALDSLREEGYARTTIIQSLAVLRIMFQQAFKGGLIPRDPCYDIKMPAQEPGEMPEEKEIISSYDAYRFLYACRDKRYFELYYILLHTGLRIGELLALEWKDINFEKKTIHVHKTLNRIRKYYDSSGKKLTERKAITQITTPKRKSSYRYVPMTDSVIEAFLSWKDKQNSDKKNMGKDWGKDNELLSRFPGLIFTSSKGMPYLPASANTECRKIINKVNKEEMYLAATENRDPIYIGFSPHTFRHTYITHCVESGMDFSTVKKISGHSHANMTEYYTHIEEEHIVDQYQQYIQKYDTESSFKSMKEVDNT